MTSPPVPGGPYKLLCPVNASKSILIASMSIGRMPAVCAASTSISAPAACAPRAISAIGKIVPTTLLAWLMAMSRVPGVIARRIASRSSEPSRAHGTTITRTPARSSARRGRITALCSMLVVTTRSPGRTMPRSARLSACVAFSVKITRSGSRTWNSSAMASRASYTIRPASMDRRCPERPGLPPARSRKFDIARITASGFGNDVAALSR